MSKRTTVVLPDGVDDVVEAVVHASAATPDFPLLKQSDVIRLLMRDATDRLVDGDLTVEDETSEVTGITGERLAEIIPDHKRGKYLYSDRKERNWLNDMREGFEVRVRNRLEERFGNGYTPEGAEAVAEEYIGEAYDFWVRIGDDRETFEEKREWVLDRLDVYREKYEATSYDPDEEFLAGWSGVEDGEASDEFEDVEGMVRAVAEDRYRDGSPSPSALAESIAFAFDADESRVREVVDEVRRESVVEDQTRAAEEDGHDALSADARAALGTAETVEDAAETVAAHAKAVDCNREDEDLDGVVLDDAEAADLVVVDVSEFETDGGEDGEVDEGDGVETDGGVDRRPGQEGYWSDLARAADDARETDGGDDVQVEDDRETVRDRIAEAFEGRIHGVAVTARRGSTFYVVVSHDAKNRGGDVVRLTTAVVDLDDEAVRPSKNSLWVPRESDTLDALTRVVARTTSDVAANDGDTPPVEAGVSEVDVGDLLSTPLGPDEFVDEDGEEVEDISPARGEAPDDAHVVEDRLAAVGVDTSERFIRLDYGEKTPWSHTRGDLDYLVENYGVYATKDDALVLVDVDDPDALNAGLVPTFKVTSPHGDDRRGHHYYALKGGADAMQELKRRLGTYNHKPTWGEVRSANQYVVGPGSVLDGCDKDECDECARPDRGAYRIVDDREIATVSVEWLVDLLLADPDVEVGEASSGEAAPVLAVDAEDDESDDVQDDGDDDRAVECHKCGATRPESEASLVASDGSTEVWACRGGCE